MMRSLLLAILALAAPASAQTPTVNAARSAGSVGERFDGYLGIAAPVSTAVRNQVATINIHRRQLYSNLAARRGASPQDVGITAGCQLLTLVGVGQSYMLSDGLWRRRIPGQPPPVPNYCR